MKDFIGEQVGIDFESKNSAIGSVGFFPRAIHCQPGINFFQRKNNKQISFFENFEEFASCFCALLLPFLIFHRAQS